MKLELPYGEVTFEFPDERCVNIRPTGVGDDWVLALHRLVSYTETESMVGFVHSIVRDAVAGGIRDAVDSGILAGLADLKKAQDAAEKRFDGGDHMSMQAWNEYKAEMVAKSKVART